MKFSTRGLRLFATSAFVLVLMASLRTDAQTRAPRLEPAECFIGRGDWARDTKIECKWLLVPEDRGNPKTNTLKLAVLILRARESNGSAPLVMLHGGPGGSGIQPFTRGAAIEKFDLHRDVVIYDQRGSGFSVPSLCPENENVALAAQRLKISAEREKFWDAEDRKCIASLDSQGVIRSAYNTAASAEDLIDLRKALGYPSWDVYGVSYGARLAQEAMRRDAKAIRSVVLESPATRGPTTQSEEPLSHQRAFERVFADCRKQSSCFAAFPTLEKDFYEVYDELNRSPLAVKVDDNPGTEAIILDGQRLLDKFRNSVLLRPGRLAGLPFLINEFRHGDKIRAAKILVSYDPQGAERGANRALVLLVDCYDVYGKQLRDERKLANAKVRPAFRDDKVEECEIWQNKYADPSEYAPVHSQIPTLLLTGRYDDRSPTEHAKQIASTLSKAYLFEFPNESHGSRPAGCHLSILKQFWDDPSKAPDATCISKLPSIQFVTSWDQIRKPQGNIPGEKIN